MNKQEWSRCNAQFRNTEKRWRTFGIIGLDIFLLFAATYLILIGKLYTVPGVLLLSIVFLHFYLLLHEATHSAVSHSKFLNDLIGHICGWIIIMPFLARKRSHLLHHAWTGHPEGDPANKRLIKFFSTITQKKTRNLERIWSSWMPLFTLNDRVGLWKDAFQERQKGNASPRIKKEIQFVYTYAAGYIACIALLIQQGILLHFLGTYFLALFILFFLEELANLPHHAEKPLIGQTDKALPYWEQHKVTHSCKSLPIWSKYVLLNFNLHTAHHAFPWAPWYSLPVLHAEVMKLIPHLEEEQTDHEISWSLENRKRSLCSIMAPYVEVAQSLPR
ncbi:fatty acid desaturase family protein [Chitinimonas sp. PSY-7]|uniref:fatty acid desaturase n=1 Tax=Chitinimonas sp. PSY-7 TaxID=3459088 RepID=UPI0040403D66